MTLALPNTEEVDTTNSEPIRAEDHMKLVFVIASRFVKKGVDVKDSEEYSDGCFGLIRAIERYDPSLNIKFSTFAWDLIEKSIIQGWRRKNAKKFKGVQANVSLNDPSLEKALPAATKTNFFQMMEMVLSNHPDDTPQDKKNKAILKAHYVDGKTWKEIGDEMGCSRAWPQQCAAKAIDLIRTRFSVEDFEKIFS